VPVLSSCLATPVAGQSLVADATREVYVDLPGGASAIHTGCGALVEYLDQVVDHRSRQGLRHELGFLLAVVIAATTCAGHDEVIALAEWAAAAPKWVLLALGATPDPLTGVVTAPSESTLRRVLAKVDAVELQRLTAQWAQASARTARAGPEDDGGAGDGEIGDAGATNGARRLAGVAIDGKSVRGAAAGGGTLYRAKIRRMTR
jgi:DDE_Tnp_1-associated